MIFPDPEDSARQAKDAMQRMGVTPFDSDLNINLMDAEADDEIDEINMVLSEYDIADEYYD